nr:TlpA disulfide reductase family protein [uncultured Draconibacterium sp.]
MKTKLIYISFLFFLFSCTKNENINGDQKTVISGLINNFQKHPDYNTIELRIPDILSGKIIQKESIDAKGTFKFELDLENATDITILYKAFFHVFITPGDSIHLTINNDFINNNPESYTELYAHCKVSGTAQKINEEVSGFFAFLEDSVYNINTLNDSVNVLAPMPIKAYLERELDKQYLALERFNNRNNTSEHFQNWAKNHLKYRTWSLLFQYPIFHNFPSSMEQLKKTGYMSLIPEEYLSFLDSFENVRNNKLLEVGSYNEFLRGYNSYINYLIPEDTIKYYRSLYQSNFKKGFDYFINHYSSNADGFIKDFLIANHYYWTLEEQHYNNLKYIVDFGQIEDSLLRKKVEKKFYYEQKIFENPELHPDANINEKVENNKFLKTLKTKYKNNVIFIDFWAPWCKPCMEEIPYAQELKKQYEKEDVVFVYLGTNCQKESWELTIKEKAIKGEHFLLTKKQSEELADIFDIRGIPHYVLLDKNGKVTRKFAPRPSSGEELTSLIDKNLKTNL